jgi:hypothetical protein
MCKGKRAYKRVLEASISHKNDACFLTWRIKQLSHSYCKSGRTFNLKFLN